MRKTFFLSCCFLLLAAPVGTFARLQSPTNLSVPTVGERSATLQWEWNSSSPCNPNPMLRVEPCGTITDFELLVNLKRDAQDRPVNSCINIANWGIAEHPGGGQRSQTVRGLERGQTYCWKVMARATNSADNSDFVFGLEFTTQLGPGDGSVCENNRCEPPNENANNCPRDCHPGGGGPPVINPGDLNPIPGTKTLAELFNKIFSFLFGLAIFIVPVIVIYAAFLMLMGGGDPEKLAKGRMILLWTAIAFMIILLSRGLPIVLKNLL